MADILPRVHSLMSSVQKMLEELTADEIFPTFQYGGYIRGLSQELLSIAQELDARDSTWLASCSDVPDDELPWLLQLPAEDEIEPTLACLDTQAPRTDFAEVAPPATPQGSGAGPSVVGSESKDASAALESLLKVVKYVDGGVKRFEERFDSWYSHDERMTHMSSILLLRRQKTCDSVAERILMTFAVISLAQDYTAFEKLSGWTPRYQLLLEGFASGRLISGKQNHLANFASALSIKDHQRLTLALGLGLKLQIIRELARDTLFGEGLALLFGVEYRSISRLSYRRLHGLYQLVRANNGPQVVCESTRNWSQWFTYRQQEYDTKYRRFPMPLIGLEG